MSHMHLTALILASFLSLAGIPEGPDDPDTDRRVPVYYYCAPHEPVFATTYAKRERDGDMRMRVRVNVCRLWYRGAGPRDVRAILRHEKYHAMGWDHGDAGPKRNKAYYEGYSVRGR